MGVPVILWFSEVLGGLCLEGDRPERGACESGDGGGIIGLDGGGKDVAGEEDGKGLVPVYGDECAPIVG